MTQHSHLSKSPAAGSAAAQADPGKPAQVRRRWKSADHAQRCELIVAVALQLLHRHGLAAVTIRRVAQRLGVGAMTLYTYFRGQQELRTEMTRRGFALMQQGCQAHTTLGGEQNWRGGAASYLRFAIDNPNLYKLMFDMPVSAGQERQVIEESFQPLVARVRERLAQRGVSAAELEHQSLISAGRFWISLHGLASLAIAQRLHVLNCQPEELLDHLLERVAPD